MKCNTGFSPSLKATAERRQEIEDDDPISGLKRAQADYEDVRAGFRNRQRQILQNVFKSVSDLIDDAAACRKFMKDKAFEKYDCTPVAGGDPADAWFRALAYVYRATSRAKRQRASKHASALRFLYKQDVDADQIAETIEDRGGIQKLADEAAKARRKGSKQGADQDDADPSAEKGEANADAEVGDAKKGADADQRVCFSISKQLADKIRSCRGKRIKIIALVPRKINDQIKVLRIIKLKSAPSADLSTAADFKSRCTASALWQLSGKK